MSELLNFQKLKWTPQLEKDEFEELVQKAQEYANSHGLKYLAPDEAATPSVAKGTVNAPYTLFPTLFPKTCFDEAMQIQRIFNELYSKVSMDDEWLDAAMEKCIDYDPFVSKLWHNALKIRQNTSLSHKLSLGIYRSDYLLHCTDDSVPCLKQVEFNNIAVSFGALSAKVNKLHRYLASSASYGSEQRFQRPYQFPQAESLDGIAQGLSVGHAAYGVPSSIILIILPENERNIFDMKPLEYRLLEHHGIRTLFRTIPQLQHSAAVNREGELMVKHLGKEEHIAVCYWRGGYSPDHYPNESVWDLRMSMESSKAINCPTFAIQLSGIKLIQQLLSKDSALERFLSNSQDIERVRKTFAELYPMDDSVEGKKALSLAMDKALCKNFVLKPQREGGGNNVYGSDIPVFIEELKNNPSMSDEMGKIESFILMSRINPPTNYHNWMMRVNSVVPTYHNTISELGIYGFCLFDRHKIIRNETIGYLLRTKDAKSNEGGVAVGLSSLDTPLLV